MSVMVLATLTDTFTSNFAKSLVSVDLKPFAASSAGASSSQPSPAMESERSIAGLASGGAELDGAALGADGAARTLDAEALAEGVGVAPCCINDSAAARVLDAPFTSENPNIPSRTSSVTKTMV